MIKILKKLQKGLKRENNMYILLGIFGAIFVVSAILMGHEIKNAPIVDDKEPFLWDDYDEKKDKTLK